MAVTYIIDSTAGIVYLTATGPTSMADIAEAQTRLRNDPSFRPTYHELFDCREARPTDIHSSQVEVLLDKSPFAATARRAYVCSSGAGYGMVRVAEALAADHLMLRLFDDIDSARRWLLEDERPPVDTKQLIEDERDRW